MNQNRNENRNESNDKNKNKNKGRIGEKSVLYSALVICEELR